MGWLLVVDPGEFFGGSWWTIKTMVDRFWGETDLFMVGSGGPCNADIAMNETLH